MNSSEINGCNLFEIHLCVLSISSSPSLLRFGFNSPLLVCFLFGGEQPLISWFDELWNHEFSRIGDFVFLRKPQSSLIFTRFLSIRESFGLDLLGICSWGSYEAFLQVSSNLDFVYSRFDIWSFVGGLSGSDRSDRSE